MTKKQKKMLWRIVITAVMLIALRFIPTLLEEADKYKAEFAAVKNESTAQNMPYAYVQKWFKKTFPCYGKQPERNENLKIVNTPVNYDEETA